MNMGGPNDLVHIVVVVVVVVYFGQHGLLHLQVDGLQAHLLQSLHVSQWQGELVLQLQKFIFLLLKRQSSR